MTGRLPRSSTATPRTRVSRETKRVGERTADPRCVPRKHARARPSGDDRIRRPTVGYGDVVPQDSVGRVIASFLLLGGLALLSVVTATITRVFDARAQRESRSDGEADVLAEIRALRAQLDELAQRLER